MLMKRLLLATVMTLALTCPAAALAATVLSDTELGGVTGGGIAPELGGQALSQDQQLPQDLGSGYAPPRELPINQGMDHAPGYFAILQSSVEARRERNLLLGGASQQGAMALEIENALSSDVVSTSNIFDGSSLSLAEAPAEVEINQGNTLNQLHRTQGRLDSSIAGYRYEKTVEHRSGSEKYERYAFSLVDRQRGSEIRRTESSAAHVQVGGLVTSFDALTAGIQPMEIISGDTYTMIPGITVDFAVDTDFWGLKGEWGGKGTYTGASLKHEGLYLESLTTKANDLVLETRLKQPTIDPGKLVGEACAGKCVNLVDVQLPLLPLGDITPKFNIPGLGPRIDVLNLGSGFALVGTRKEMKIDNPDISINGKASIKVTPYLKLTLDLSSTKDIGWVAKLVDTDHSDGDGIWKITLDQFGEIKPPPVAFSLDLSGLGGQPYEDKKPGGNLFLGGDGTGNETQSADEKANEWDHTSGVTASFDAAESSFSESREHSVFTGGQMAAAEAEMIALSDGTLDVNHTSNVQLGDGAQQGMRTVNGVNAVSSVAANALNVSRMSTIRAGSPAGVRSITTQHNRFNQQK